MTMTDETKMVGGTQPTKRTMEATAVFVAASVLVPRLDENDLEALHLTRLAADEDKERQEAPTGTLGDLGPLVARLEARRGRPSGAQRTERGADHRPGRRGRRRWPPRGAVGRAIPAG